MRSYLSVAAFGAGVGAGLMFLLDPRLGRRRRALLRDKAVSFSRQAVVAVDKTSRDVKNRTYGTVVSIKTGHVMDVRPSILNANWPPATRLMAGAAGCAVTATGIAKGGVLGSILGAVGLGTVGLAVTNFSIRNLLNRSESAGQIPVRNAA
jgi:outer membrane lipoprotein SlyB